MLARDLLHLEGAIFVSIDDHEIFQLGTGLPVTYQCLLEKNIRLHYKFFLNYCIRI
jgi:hypothetical protein